MNTITIELCAEDRARLDAILEALKAKNCDKCVASALEFKKAVQESPKEPQEATKDEAIQDINRKLKDALENTEAPAPTTTAPADVAPWEAPSDNPFPDPVKAEPEPAPAPDVKLSDIQGLVVKLATTGKKAEARDIVKAYAERVTEIPPEKYGEVFVKLKALEG